MNGRDFIVDPSQIDYTNILADIDEIRLYNHQRYAMEQLTAIVYDDPETHTCVGYRDTSHEEFWVAGHMPEKPLMPGVIMCEAAAQVCTYHSGKHDLLGCEFVGFGGLDKVKFRGMVSPGERVTIAAQITNLRRGRMFVGRFEAFSDNSLVCEGEIRGVPLPIDKLQ